MTDKQKIKFIYIGVAVICSAILGLSFFLATLRKEQRSQGPAAVDTGVEEVGDIMVLEQDIDLQKEDGTPVKISDLKDKVWLAVQFYVTCPMCAERNAAHLSKIYQEFKNNPDFQVVCFSVDPDEDTPEKIGEIRELLSADPQNWWFLKTEREKLWDYMRYQMLFADIRERTDPAHIAAEGRWAHDLGIQVYRGNTLVKKWHTGLELDVLRDEIKAALMQIKEQP